MILRKKYCKATKTASQKVANKQNRGKIRSSYDTKAVQQKMTYFTNR